MMKNNHLDLQSISFQDGEREVGKLLEEYWNPLYVYIFSMLQNKQDAEDVLAGLCEKVYSKKTGWEEVKNMRAYLFTMARNMCIDRRREEERHGAVVTGDTAMGWMEGLADDTHAAPDYRMIYAEISSELWKSVDGLPDKYRDIFIRHCLLEESFVSIGRDLGLTPQTVSSRYEKALNLLKANMPGGWPPNMLFLLLALLASSEIKF